MKVPFVDLQAQYLTIKEDIDAAIATVIRDSAFIGGPYVASFEKSFADYCGTRLAVGVSSGTDALRLALLACGVKPRDEVITVPNTFIATAEAITMVGAEVRFVDVTPGSFTMDPERLEEAITEKTRALIPVHLYGHPADMDPILEIARRRGLRVVADAAQAHGALYRGLKVGTLGDAACFSFYPGKNLGAYGDAGAVVTNDPDIAAAVRLLRDHGRTEKYKHEREAFNCRMDGIQAAILSVKLRHLDNWIERRRSHAATYYHLLSKIRGVQIPEEDESMRAAYHLYAIRVGNRRELQRHLMEAGVETGIHYPIPLHRQRAYAHLGLPEGSFPVAEKLASEVMSLPMYPELTEDQIRFVSCQIELANMCKSSGQSPATFLKPSG